MVSAALLSALFAIAPVAAAMAVPDERPPTLSGTYSSVCVHRDSLDLLGLELSFTRSGDVTYVLMQPYEGEAGVPELLKVRASGPRMFVHSENAGDVLSLEVRDEGLVAVWLSGRVGASGERREELVHARAVWNGEEPGYCGEDVEPGRH